MGFNALRIVTQHGGKILSKAGFWASRHASELLTAAGVVGFVGTCFFVAKGTI